MGVYYQLLTYVIAFGEWRRERVEGDERRCAR